MKNVLKGFQVESFPNRSLTKPITLESVMEQFRDLLMDECRLGDFRKGIPDFKVMEELGFTPQSWGRYRPMIIQYCQNNDLIKEEVRYGVTIETINLRVKYVQRSKEWYGKMNPLCLHEKDDYGFKIRSMTSGELDQYGIVWFPEKDFLY